MQKILISVAGLISVALALLLAIFYFNAESAARVRSASVWIEPRVSVAAASADSSMQEENSAEGGAPMSPVRLGRGARDFLKSLDGVWYKSGESALGLRVAFDSSSLEVIFLDESTQEVFAIEGLSIQGAGAYIATHNKLIPSIGRFVNIEMSEENIAIGITDSVGLNSRLASTWNGSYQKLQNVASPQSANSAQRIAATLEGESAGWKDGEGATWIFLGNILIKEDSSSIEEKRYTVYMAQKSPVMQVKSIDGESTFYLLSEGPSGQIVLQEASAFAEGFKAKNTAEIALTRQ